MGTDQKIILMQGPPASGKSTIAMIEQARDPENMVIVSRDALRHARGKYWIPSQERYIAAIEQYAVDEALCMGYTVIVDATNMNPIVINDFIAMAEARFIPVYGWMVHETLEKCLERDRSTIRLHNVGETIITDFYKKYVDYCNQHNIEMVPGTVTKYPIYDPKTTNTIM